MQPEEQACTKIDELPTGIIGLCGSFLDQDSYGQLSNVNRAIYLGCNSPNTLRELEVEYQFPSDHQSLDFSVFPFARELTLRMNFIDRHGPYISTGRMNLIASQIANMSRLESLHLPGVSSEFIKIIGNHETTNQRIASLTANLDSPPRYYEEAYKPFVASLAAFQHIEILRLHMNCGGESADDSTIKLLVGMCSNLKGLDLYDSNLGIEMAVLQAIGHQLHYLDLHDVQGEAMSALKNVNFANLRQLEHGQECSMNSLQAILNRAVNLERVNLRKEQAVELIDDILHKCNKLTYLEIVTEIMPALSALQHCLLYSRGLQRRQSLTIRIFGCFEDRRIVENKECIIKLARIVYMLSLSKLDQWMIILDVFDCIHNLMISLLNDLAGALGPDVANMCMIMDKHRLIVNSGGAISDWKDTWYMSGFES